MNQVTCVLTVKEIVEKLFDPDERRLGKIITELNANNKRISGTTVDGFRYMGFHVIAPDAKMLGRLPVVDKSLEDQVEKYLIDKRTIDKDRQIIRQALVTLLTGCKTDQHFRDALPDCIISLVPGLKNLRRYDEPGWTLKHDQRLYRQFQQVLPKMEMYSAVGLFY
jgi:hypothetical protein